ncbi:MAG: alpha/beta fold hydrolase [Verrucomicrobiota bacterium JB022]|nr:alpha/beta fold hydrolase [Verrucomicrobiota bacterium JB022]
MPILDLPLDKLRTYTGRNPRPADFDAFWQQSREELATIAPEVELKPAAFQTPLAICSNLYFSGTHGARVHAKLLRPKHRPADGSPILLHFHGYSGNSGDWINLLPWVASGFTVAAMDCRGQGGLSEDIGPARGGTLYGHVVKGLDDTPDRLYYRNVFLDTARLAEVVRGLDGVNPDRVASMGGSQGGALALICAALVPEVSRTVSMHPFLCDYQRVWEMDQAKAAYIGLYEYFRRFDPRHEREVEAFTRLGYIDVQHHAPSIQAEVLMATGLMDPICPPSTQFAAYNKIRTPKDIAIYPDFHHEMLPGFYDQAYGFLGRGWVM